MVGSPDPDCHPGPIPESGPSEWSGTPTTLRNDATRAKLAPGCIGREIRPCPAYRLPRGDASGRLVSQCSGAGDAPTDALATGGDPAVPFIVDADWCRTLLGFIS
ncbi:hypothetical protein Scep_009788 [Stephania cephalantha]|uniref:Uncharacterized protein n=1 Tax=Stephania cephalantha TaxID=152367 RepID=A0AAP0PDG7_9MAGN